ncbi:TonB-dependent receptor [Reichenbachiella versicolor]|uniref:TonB-dependent receptor n=1 Tax=Reichenbachiella versicolor TaxID=1821036 RepID=UPI001FECBCC5|nr:TonB-dependent receptor [Reichenbachiella versicolor]
MMIRLTKQFALSILCLVMLGYSAVAQTSISGSVVDGQSNAPLLGVSILVKGKVIGTISDTQGNFSLDISSAPPLTLVFSMVGYTTVELDVNQANIQGLEVMMEESAIMGQEVVVSASKFEESVMESPVSVEKMDVLSIRETAAPSFYDAMQNFKGVDLSAQSMTFKSINIRGFGANGNVRLVQTIDGIDNVAPGLNFAVGNIVGINDLDLESAELLPGASSALYGPNALNGALVMRSKSPFDYQGLSAYTKLGVNHVDGEDDDPALYQDYGIRYAKAFNNKLAVKVTASYLTAQDFRGVDERDKSSVWPNRGDGQGYVVETQGRNRESNRAYEGVNVYGDPTIGLESLGHYGSRGQFSPTGFTESSFVDNTISSVKLGGALHYRVNDDMEVIGQFNWGNGSTVYTANDRFVLDGFSIWTGKLEVKGTNYYGRAYMTQEASGDSYAANTVASLINVENYVPDYVGAFQAGRDNGLSYEAAHAQARAYADGRQEAYAPGTAVFQQKFDSLNSLSIKDGGSKFKDNSNLIHAEGGYSFSDLVDWAEVQVGANFRRYNLNSEGTLFALEDNGDEQSYNEYGGYVQVTKRFLDDRLKVQASGRYDKNDNFDGQFSPRVSVVGTVAKDHNFRGSFQRGFRIPTAQDQFIDLDVAVRRLVGSNQLLIDRYGFLNSQSLVYSTASIVAAQANNDASLLETSDKIAKGLTTEKVNTFELGYRGLYLDNKLMLDGYYYHSFYQDFIGEILFQQVVSVDPAQSEASIRENGYNTPENFDASSDEGKSDIASGNLPTGTALQEFGFDVNADGTVESHGWGIEAAYFLTGGYRVGGNVSYDNLLDAKDLESQGFRAQYNTPKYKFNVSLSNREVVDNLGFNLTWRWQQAFYWESSYGNGVIPEFGTLDAQISYKLSNIKSIVKLGGSNVLNKRYTTGFGNPNMGALYYVSITFDEFLN